MTGIVKQWLDAFWQWFAVTFGVQPEAWIKDVTAAGAAILAVLGIMRALHWTYRTFWADPRKSRRDKARHAETTGKLEELERQNKLILAQLERLAGTPASPRQAEALAETVASAEAGAQAGDTRMRQALVLLAQGNVTEAEPLSAPWPRKKPRASPPTALKPPRRSETWASSQGTPIPSAPAMLSPRRPARSRKHLRHAVARGHAKNAGNLAEAEHTLNTVVALASKSGDASSLYRAMLGLGDIKRARGNLTNSLASYREAAADADRLAKADPDNAGWQRDLSVSYDRVGDVLVAQGNLPGALKSFEGSLAIADRLAKADPDNAGWQRDLSVSYNKVGDVLVAQGNLPGALKSFEASLAIADRLARADPDNAGWQRDLSVSYDRVGDVLVAQGNLPGALKSFEGSLAIRDRLARADPDNAGWQRDLWMAYGKVADVLIAQGNLAGGSSNWNAAHEITTRLAKADPSNAGWQRDLSVSYIKVGEVLVAQGNLPGALKSFEGSLAIRDRLARADPGNAGWQADLAASHGKLGQLYVAMGDKAEARRMFERGRGIVAPFAEKSGHRLWIGYLRGFDAEIAALDGEVVE